VFRKNAFVDFLFVWGLVIESYGLLKTAPETFFGKKMTTCNEKMLLCVFGDFGGTKTNFTYTT